MLLVATQVGIRELLEGGVHFGHQTRRWNPKMRRFIHGERGGIYIIDLLKTQVLLAQAQEFALQLSHRGGVVLFVGTKKQAKDGIKELAESCGMPYIDNRWLGGLLTNFQTISQRIKRLHDLERYEAEGQLELLPTRERMAARADLAKLRNNLGGVKNMKRPPDAIFIIDLKTEVIAVQEARRLRIPIIGLVDTNCDPDGIDYVVPGNDDAIRACNTITKAIADVVAEGYGAFAVQEQERQRAEGEAQARRVAEQQAARAAEEQARREEQAGREQAARDRQAAAVAAAGVPATPPGTPQDDIKVTAEGGGDRSVAEAQVAAAVAAEGRPVADPSVTPRANEEHPEAADRRTGTSPGVAVTADEPQIDPASVPETPLTDALDAAAARPDEETPDSDG